jgi:hypothetical protein
MEENLTEEKKENIEKDEINEEKINEILNNNEENGDKVEELEEKDEGINKEDINNIVEYLTNLDFDKYSRDMEIKEALMVLKTKMDKDQEIKEKQEQNQKDKITLIEDNENISNNKKEGEEENAQQTIYKDKKIVPIEENKIMEKKEPKEIIDEEELKKKEEIEKYKLAEQIAKSDALKDVHSVKSVQKLLMRENIDNQAPLRITVIKENPIASYDDYMPNKLPFLRSLPLV